MNKKQRQTLISFKESYEHVVVQGCADDDCNNSYQETLKNLLALCAEAKRDDKAIASRRDRKSS
jgi:hypothetical protein